MKTLTIRGVPEELHERLRQSAKKNRRSLNQEVVAELSMIQQVGDNFAGSGRSKAAYFIGLSEELRAGIIMPLTSVEITAGIKEGRK